MGALWKYLYFRKHRKVSRGEMPAKQAVLRSTQKSAMQPCHPASYRRAQSEISVSYSSHIIMAIVLAVNPGPCHIIIWNGLFCQHQKLAKLKESGKHKAIRGGGDYGSKWAEIKVCNDIARPQLLRLIFYIHNLINARYMRARHAACEAASYAINQCRKRILHLLKCHQ